MEFVPRVCVYCSKPMGTVAFRYVNSWGRSVHDYFHPPCFTKFKAEGCPDLSK